MMTLYIILIPLPGGDHFSKLHVLVGMCSPLPLPLNSDLPVFRLKYYFPHSISDLTLKVLVFLIFKSHFNQASIKDTPNIRPQTSKFTCTMYIQFQTKIGVITGKKLYSLAGAVLTYAFVILAS